ncbi:MAG: hypothetical protein QOF76_265 [Solirubrobacteraceae bacterium]|nr:hypothetical protein [Solirubrobacteraceae bacterium]
MIDILTRAGALFLAPPRDARTSSRPPVAPLVAVLAEPCTIAAATGGVAAALRRPSGARAAVVCRPVPLRPGLGAAPGDLRDGAPPPPGRAVAGRPPDNAADAVETAHATDLDAARPSSGGVATVGAGRLARRLSEHGVPAAGSGALCVVMLPDDVEAAVRLVWRAMATAGDAPVVVGVTGRTAALDAFLAQADRLVLATRAGADATFVDVALGSLTRLGPPVEAITLPVGVLARRAAALGFARLVAATPEAAIA